MVATALIGLSLRPASIDFFERLARRAGNKRDGRMDPVEAVLAYVERLKQERSSWVNASQEDLCARSMRALQAWEGGETGQYWFKSKPRALDIRPLVALVKLRKGVADEARL